MAGFGTGLLLTVAAVVLAFAATEATPGMRAGVEALLILGRSG